ncbi:phytanoyl-CoA dioxygenase family protein [Oscillatoria amoena NRMC-F 0135]|nr:phytanoyl-CoA dioxygenase family protein [Oscillatoria amoena NRMC-F 0135]
MQTTTPRLSEEQIAQYRKDGYILYREPVLPESKFAALKEHFEDKLLRLPEGYRPEAMDVPHFTDTKLFEWLFADEVLDLVEPLIGPDICLWSSHFICKPKGDGKRVPYHEDSAYWGKIISPMDIVTVWLAIDESTRENGCMYVVPGSHGHGYSNYEDVPDKDRSVFGIEIVKPERHEERAIPCELQPNQASLHHAKIIHGGPANTSQKRRCGYTMRYMSAACKFNEAGYSNHNIYLARGKNLAGNRLADPTKSYDELAHYREKHSRGGH